MGNISIEICLICLKNTGGVYLGEVGKKVFYDSGVSVDGFGAFSFENEPLNKGTSSRICSGTRVIFPSDLLCVHTSS